ncbi:MAG: hypothetical protein HWN66_13130 [Candidatus Helarchaeota archaeon]|nr:hypothetical protein [Candidatus Helarchaeota archaeon]
MTNLRINLPEELDKEFRKIIASKYGFSKGALSLATQDAILRWIIKNGKEPWLYIDGNMTLDMDDEVISTFLKSVLKTLKPEKIRISFRATQGEIQLITKLFENCEVDGDDILFTLENSEFNQTHNQLKKVIGVQNKQSLLFEFDDVSIISGGNGCFSIDGAVSAQKYNLIVKEFLTKLNKEIPPKLGNLKNYQLMFLNPGSTPLILRGEE